LIALVRHGAAGERRASDDASRPLTAKGRLQAEGLIEALSAVKLARIVSSPYLRCVQTVEPLARARGLKVEEEPALAEGGDIDTVLALMRRLAPEGAALCSHGDVIGAVVDELIGAGLIKPEEARFSKGSTWLLDYDGDGVKAARYVPPVTAS
jgi:8-oxo-dGTP diphosphatase